MWDAYSEHMQWHISCRKLKWNRILHALFLLHTIRLPQTNLTNLLISSDKQKTVTFFGNKSQSTNKVLNSAVWLWHSYS